MEKFSQLWEGREIWAVLWLELWLRLVHILPSFIRKTSKKLKNFVMHMLVKVVMQCPGKWM